MAPKRDLDQLLALALAAVEAKRPKFERRAGDDRRTGSDRRALKHRSQPPTGNERRTGRDRRRGIEQRVVTTTLPHQPTRPDEKACQ